MEITEQQYKEAFDTCQEYLQQQKNKIYEISKNIEAVNINKTIYDIDLSVRVLNLLRANEDDLGFDFRNDPFVKLASLRLRDLYKIRGFGRKSVLDLRDTMKYHGIEMKH